MKITGYLKRSDIEGGFLSINTHSSSVTLNEMEVFEFKPELNPYHISIDIEITEEISHHEITEEDIKKLKKKGLIV